VSSIEGRHGAIDVRVNNAGVGSSGPIESIDLDKALAVYDTNVWGAIRTVRAVLPAMRASSTPRSSRAATGRCRHLPDPMKPIRTG